MSIAECLDETDQWGQRRTHRRWHGDNAYLRRFMDVGGDTFAPRTLWDAARQGQPVKTSYEWRHELVRLYAWAVPTDEALDVIARYAPIAEIGAGTGYWAYLLRRRGVDVIAYDLAPPALATSGPPQRRNHYHEGMHCWTEVRAGGARRARRHPDRTLLLCWPPYATPMADVALRSYRGQTVVYIGEGDGGCTGDDAFHRRLAREWDETLHVGLPQWHGIYDSLTVYRRKETGR